MKKISHDFGCAGKIVLALLILGLLKDGCFPDNYEKPRTSKLDPNRVAVKYDWATKTYTYEDEVKPETPSNKVTQDYHPTQVELNYEKYLEDHKDEIEDYDK